MIINQQTVSEVTRQILASANSIATKHRLAFTGTRQVLMAMCVEPEFLLTLSEVISFHPEDMYDALAERIAPAEQHSDNDPLRFTTAFLETLKAAAVIARDEFERELIEPEHLLLAILKTGHPDVIGTVKEFGFDYDDLLAVFKRVAMLATTDPLNAS
jgi:ATP-dependent Clp protease ATP-binding subunit ClpA